MELCEKTLILMVDNEPDMLNISKAFLEQDGRYWIDTSSSAVEALHSKDVGSYDAIVSDYQMPEMDGIEFLRQLRTQGIDVPFILLTGKGREEIAMKALNSGADYYLTKGADVKTQYAMLSDFIDKAVFRHGATENLEHNLKRFKKLVESTSEIIEIVDSNRIIRYINPAVEHYWGKKPEEMIGTRLMSDLPKHDQERLEGTRCSLLDGELEKAKAFVKARHAEGSFHLLEYTASRFVDGRLGVEIILNTKEVPMDQAGRNADIVVPTRTEQSKSAERG